MMPDENGSCTAARHFRPSVQAGSIGIRLVVAARTTRLLPLGGWPASQFGDLNAPFCHGVESYGEAKVTVDRWPHRRGQDVLNSYDPRRFLDVFVDDAREGVT